LDLEEKTRKFFLDFKNKSGTTLPLLTNGIEACEAFVAGERGRWLWRSSYGNPVLGDGKAEGCVAGCGNPRTPEDALM